ncbi:MAG: alpha/beta fold hydrolase [Flavobacteriales bacterium]
MEFASPDFRAPDRLVHDSTHWRMEYVLRKNNSHRVIIAFHGFARPLEDMLVFQDKWPENASVLSIHLMHHGQSGPVERGDHPIAPSVWMDLIREVLAKHDFIEAKVDLVGYSIGGRIALTLLAEAPTFWNHVLLLAPDGLVKNPFYRITVHTRLGRWVWFAMDRHAKKVMQWNDRFLAWGIISKHLHEFGRFHMSSHEMRMMVWHGWRSHRCCWPRHLEITNALSKREVSGAKTTCIFGQKDKIIPVRNARRLRRMTRELQHVHFEVIPSGHGMLQAHIVDHIINCTFCA